MGDGLREGCVLQLEIEWEAPLASATFSFQLVNVASQPRVRLRRLRLRGTVRLQWEWRASHPHIGRLRCAFVRPPEVAQLDRTRRAPTSAYRAIDEP